MRNSFFFILHPLNFLFAKCKPGCSIFSSKLLHFSNIFFKIDLSVSLRRVYIVNLTYAYDIGISSLYWLPARCYADDATKEKHTAINLGSCFVGKSRDARSGGDCVGSRSRRWGITSAGQRWEPRKESSSVLWMAKKSNRRVRYDLFQMYIKCITIARKLSRYT